MLRTAILTLATALLANAQGDLSSSTFSSCASNNSLQATTFAVAVHPSNSTLEYDLFGTSSFSGNATINFFIVKGSQTYYHYSLDPCTGTGWETFCPAQPMQIALNSNQNAPEGTFDDIPSEGADFRLVLTDRRTNSTVGCLDAPLMSDAAGNGTANGTDSGNSTSTMSGDSNETDSSSNSSDSSGGDDSGASTLYLNWTLLLCGIFALVFNYGL